VLSPSEESSPADLAEGCLALAGDDIVGRHSHGVRLVDDALRLLVAAGTGLFAAVVIEMVITMIAFHHGLVDGLLLLHPFGGHGRRHAPGRPTARPGSS